MKSLKKQFNKSKETEILATYKKKMKKYFIPSYEMQTNFYKANQLLYEYKVLNPSIPCLIDLMLHFVECGVDITGDYGDNSEQFFDSIENTFISALKLITEENDKSSYQKRTLKIAKKAIKANWDAIPDIYYHFFKRHE